VPLPPSIYFRRINGIIIIVVVVASGIVRSFSSFPS
jgi:hypothetical protein